MSKPELPQKIADALGGFYKTVLNKYYVDEIYAKLFVKPSGRWIDKHSVAGRRSQSDRRLREQCRRWRASRIG